MMKFEYLPNEILFQCFEYFNAFEIFHSFDQLNSRFNNLILHVPLYLNFQDVNKSIFDQFYTKIKLNPQIKDQIYSFHLSDEHEYLQDQILSFFSLNQLPRLRKIEAIFPLESSSHLNIKYIHETLPIINLTISTCYLTELYQLLKYTPVLKYLHVKKIQSSHLKDTENVLNDRCKQMILDCSNLKFDDLDILIKQTSTLKKLIIFASDNIDIIDAERWEHFITSSLPHLNTFRFKFSYCFTENKDTIVIDKFKQFQTDFWQEQHHWYTEYIIKISSAFIYTIPYISNTYQLTSYKTRYCNNLISKVNTFENVTDLMLHERITTKNCQYYFPNVTSLTLTRADYPTKYIEYLKMFVNLFNLKHLHIAYTYRTINSSIILDILQEAPYLSSMTIISDIMKQLINEKELCKALNSRIKRLYIGKYCKFLGDSDFEAEQFCEIFSNIEYLQCSIDREDTLLFLRNHLLKLSNLKVTWTSLYDHEKVISRLENEARKLNGLYDIKTYYHNYEGFDDMTRFQPRDWCEIKIFFWFEKNITFL